MRNKSLMRLAVCLIGMAAMVLQGCSESGTDRDKLCGLIGAAFADELKLSKGNGLGGNNTG